MARSGRVEDGPQPEKEVPHLGGPERDEECAEREEGPERNVRLARGELRGEPSAGPERQLLLVGRLGGRAEQPQAEVAEERRLGELAAVHGALSRRELGSYAPDRARHGRDRDRPEHALPPREAA